LKTVSPHGPSYRRKTLLRRKAIMTKPVQLLLPLEMPGDQIQLPADDEEDLVAAVASLLLQVLVVEKEGEVENDL
jgi:hypothetical protein